MSVPAMRWWIGDVCRAKCTAPARYIGDLNGVPYCLFISAMCNDMCADEARPATGGESGLPLPTSRDVDVASVALTTARMALRREASA